MKLKDAYTEACNCGYKGTFLDWIKSVGITIEDLDRIKENKEVEL